MKILTSQVLSKHMLAFLDLVETSDKPESVLNDIKINLSKFKMSTYHHKRLTSLNMGDQPDTGPSHAHMYKCCIILTHT